MRGIAPVRRAGRRRPGQAPGRGRAWTAAGCARSPARRCAERHGDPARADRRGRQRLADPARAGARLVPDAREGRVATTDAQGRFEIKELPAGRYTMTRQQGRLRRRCSTASGGRPNRARRSSSATAQTMDKIVDRAAARQRARRPHHRRIRRARGQRERQRVALRLCRRRAAADAGRTERARHHRRSGTVPAVRPAARRLLRQRDAAQRRPRSHRSDGRALRLRGDLLSRARRTSPKPRASRWPSRRRTPGQLRLDRDAAGPRLRPGDHVRRRAGDQRHGDAGAGERERAARRRDAAGRRRRPHRSDRRVPDPERRARPLPGAGANAGGREFELARMDLVGRRRRCRRASTLVTAAGRDASPARSSATPASRSISAPQQLQIAARPAIAGRQAMPGGGMAARASATTGPSSCATSPTPCSFARRRRRGGR